MKTVVKKISEKLSGLSLKLMTCCERSATTIMAVFGVGLLVVGLSELSLAQSSFSQAAYDDTLVQNAVGQLFCLIEGAFGALIMVVAGLGAIVAAAMGAYRAAVGMLVVAVGAFILRALVSLFFGTNFDVYSAGNGCA